MLGWIGRLLEILLCLILLPIALGVILLWLSAEWGTKLYNHIMCKIYKHKVYVSAWEYSKYKAIFDNRLKRRYYYIEPLHEYCYHYDTYHVIGYNFRMMRGKDYTWMSLIL